MSKLRLTFNNIIPAFILATTLSFSPHKASSSVLYSGDNCVTPTSITISCSMADGSLSVTPPDIVSVDDLTVGQAGGGFLGQATISGVGAGITVASQLTVGTNGGVGLLNIQDGGHLNFSGTVASIGFFGGAYASLGTINILGNGSSVSLSGTTSVGGGTSDTGTINVGSGGVLTARLLQLGGAAGGQAFLTVGSGGTANVDGLSIESGKATIEGSMNAGSIGRGIGPFPSSLNVTSGGSLAAGSIDWGSAPQAPSLYIGGGSTAIADTLSIGTGPTVLGTMTVKNRFTLGGTGLSSLKVQNGGIFDLTGTSATIGSFPGSSATINVSGNGSKINLAGSTSVGANTGTVTVKFRLRRRAHWRFCGVRLFEFWEGHSQYCGSGNCKFEPIAHWRRNRIDRVRRRLRSGQFSECRQFSRDRHRARSVQQWRDRVSHLAKRRRRIRLEYPDRHPGQPARHGYVDRNPRQFWRHRQLQGIGASFGQLNLHGNLFLQGTLDLSVGGLGASTRDFLQVSGGANLSGGTIQVDFTNGYVPQAGDVIPLLSAGGGIGGTPSITINQSPAIPYQFDNGNLTFLGSSVPTTPTLLQLAQASQDVYSGDVAPPGYTYEIDNCTPHCDSARLRIAAYLSNDKKELLIAIRGTDRNDPVAEIKNIVADATTFGLGIDTLGAYVSEAASFRGDPGQSQICDS